MFLAILRLIYSMYQLPNLTNIAKKTATLPITAVSSNTYTFVKNLIKNGTTKNKYLNTMASSSTTKSF